VHQQRNKVPRRGTRTLARFFRHSVQALGVTIPSPLLLLFTAASWAPIELAGAGCFSEVAEEGSAMPCAVLSWASSSIEARCGPGRVGGACSMPSTAVGSLFGTWGLREWWQIPCYVRGIARRAQPARRVRERRHVVRALVDWRQNTRFSLARGSGPPRGNEGAWQDVPRLEWPMRLGGRADLVVLRLAADWFEMRTSLVGSSLPTRRRAHPPIYGSDSSRSRQS
jgi:hypothetical protein